MVLQLVANGLIMGLLYALITLGFALIYSTSRVFHIAHGAVYTLAAYGLYVTWREWHGPFWLGMGVALGLAAGAGVLMELGVYRPLMRRDAPPIMALIGSIGLYTIVVNLIAMAMGNEIKVLRPGLARTVSVGPVILTDIQILTALVSLCVTVGFLLALRKTSWGRLIRAVRDNPVLVEVMGYNLSSIRAGVFAVGSVLAGAAAILQALDVGIEPHGGMSMLLNAAVAMIVGGVGVFEGAVLGAVLLGVLQSLVIWKISSQWVDGVTFLLLIGFLVFRPQGIWGVRQRVEEMVE